MRAFITLILHLSRITIMITISFIIIVIIIIIIIIIINTDVVFVIIIIIIIITTRFFSRFLGGVTKLSLCTAHWNFPSWLPCVDQQTAELHDIPSGEGHCIRFIWPSSVLGSGCIDERRTFRIVDFEYLLTVLRYFLFGCVPFYCNLVDLRGDIHAWTSADISLTV